MKRFLYSFFVAVIRPGLHLLGFDIVAWHKRIADAEVWREVLKFGDFAKSYVPIRRSQTKKTKIIWQFWWQGVENAPPIVKACMKSVRDHANGWDVVVVDRSNFSKYVNVHEDILKHLQAGVMSIAHFSDYLRARLLAEHGGIWADATVYLTDSIPDEISNSDFFMFKSALWANAENIPDTVLLAKCVHVAGRDVMGGGGDAGSSWFLVSRAGSPILTLTAELIEKYWEVHDSLIDYFLFHKFVSLCVCVNDVCREEYLSSPKKTNIPPHLLQFSLLDDPDDVLLAAIKSVSQIHKLTYKLSECPRFIRL